MQNKDIQIILNYYGDIDKSEATGYLYPYEESDYVKPWDIEDYQEAVKLCQFGERWFRHCIAKLKGQQQRTAKEIEEITKE